MGLFQSFDELQPPRDYSPFHSHFDFCVLSNSKFDTFGFLKMRLYLVVCLVALLVTLGHSQTDMKAGLGNLKSKITGAMVSATY